MARIDPFHFVVHLHDLKLQVFPRAPQHGNQVPHSRGEVLVDVLKHLRQSFPQPNRALGEHDAPLQISESPMARVRNRRGGGVTLKYFYTSSSLPVVYPPPPSTCPRPPP